ncbi:phage replisome organizer N-terminal domain-containing protein [Megasphaera elsdenii]
MAFNDNKVYYFIKMDERFTDDLNIILLKTTPGGMEVIYTYLELMILAGKTGGMLIDSGTFSSFPKQLSYELKGITPEQITAALNYFISKGYILVQDQKYVFQQAPLLTRSERGITRRKERARLRSKERPHPAALPEPPDKKYPQNGIKDIPTKSGMSSVASILNKVGIKKDQEHHDGDVLFSNEQHHTQGEDEIAKRQYLVEAGISMHVVMQLIKLPHVQTMTLDRLKAIKAYADTKAKKNPAAYLKTLLEDSTLKLPNEITNAKKEKVPDPNCPYCHGTGTRLLRIFDEEYTEEQSLPCDCWKYYQQGGN